MAKVLVSGSAGFIRHYTYGRGLAAGAAGIVTAVEHPDARNEDFSRSTAQARTTLDDTLDEVIPWISQAVEAGTI